MSQSARSSNFFERASLYRIESRACARPQLRLAGEVTKEFGAVLNLTEWIVGEGRPKVTGLTGARNFLDPVKGDRGSCISSWECKGARVGCRPALSRIEVSSPAL